MADENSQGEPRPGLERLRAAVGESPMRKRPGPPVYPPASEAAPGSQRLRAALDELWKDTDR